MRPSSAPTTLGRSRWQRLQDQHGVFGALRAYWFGERPARITEHEPRVPWYVNAMIYATSLAMIFVFGLAEIEAIPHQPPWLAGVLVAVLGLLFIMIYAMDRSLARTIPRIGLLWHRGQYSLWLEHLAYAICVGTVEATTYGLVIYTLDVNVDSILHGRPLIPPQSRWLLALVVVRSVVLVWTIAHAYLTHEELPPQWSTGQRQMVELLGGQMVRRIQQLKVDLLPIGKVARAYMLFLQPEPHAAWRWNRREWRQDQAAALLNHREQVVQALEDLDAAIRTAEQRERAGDERQHWAEAVVALPARGSSAGDDHADMKASDGERGADGNGVAERPTLARTPIAQQNGHSAVDSRGEMRMRSAPTRSTGDLARPVSMPMPGTDAYLAVVRQARAYLLSVRRSPTVEAVATYLHERPEDIRRAFALIEEQDLAARRARSPRQRQPRAGTDPAVPSAAPAAVSPMAAGA